MKSFFVLADCTKSYKRGDCDMTSLGYDEKHIHSLDWREHIRLRPGMYIGKTGDGSTDDDGIYILLKEVLDNSIDEFVMGAGTKIEISMQDRAVWVRDYGRGIPFGKLIDCVAKINTGGKYNSQAFSKSVGLNGVGIKAVNALSSSFVVRSLRNKQCKEVVFSKGKKIGDEELKKTREKNGTEICFEPDESIFNNYYFRAAIVEQLVWHYCYLNSGLTVSFNKKSYKSKNGLEDLLSHKISGDKSVYPVVHLQEKDLEIAFTHLSEGADTCYSYVNGQYTSMGGSHQTVFREAYVKAIKEHYKKNFEVADIRSGLICAISVRVEDPIFESQTKTKLGSSHRSPGKESLREWIFSFLVKAMDDYLYRHSQVKKSIYKQIMSSEKRRKEIATIRKVAQERSKKVKLFNNRLRDCRIHNNTKDRLRYESAIFITEGCSASGSITKSRNVSTQAVFSLRGKPLNCYGASEKIVYENEEFNLLRQALNLDAGVKGLRYNKIIIATDADVDGMHIRLLLMTFFLQFYLEVVLNGHVHILQTPLFRVRDKKKTMYCYTEEEKKAALKLIRNPEITRFKGLGEISPEEFKAFIGPNMKYYVLAVEKEDSIRRTLHYFMGKNSLERQSFIVDNLRREHF